MFEHFKEIILVASLITLSLSIIAIFIRALVGPKVTDRIICVNMIGTKIIIIICIAAALLHEDFIIDVAIVYALVNFVSMVVLTYAYKHSYLKSKDTVKKEAR